MHIKAAQAAKQNRVGIAEVSEAWLEAQPGLDPTKLLLLDEADGLDQDGVLVRMMRPTRKGPEMSNILRLKIV